MTNAYTDIDEIMLSLNEVLAGKGVEQGPWHDYDVFGHTIAVVNVLKSMDSSRKLVAAGYLHDIGKPVVRTFGEKEGKIHYDFRNHEKVGGDMVDCMDQKIFHSLRLTQKEIADLVRYHFVIMSYAHELKKDPNTFKSKICIIQEELCSLPIKYTDIVDLFYADKLGQGKTSDQDLMLSLYKQLKDTNLPQ